MRGADRRRVAAVRGDSTERGDDGREAGKRSVVDPVAHRPGRLRARAHARGRGAERAAARARRGPLGEAPLVLRMARACERNRDRVPAVGPVPAATTLANARSNVYKSENQLAAKPWPLRTPRAGSLPVVGRLLVISILILLLPIVIIFIQGFARLKEDSPSVLVIVVVVVIMETFILFVIIHVRRRRHHHKHRYC